MVRHFLNAQPPAELLYIYISILELENIALNFFFQDLETVVLFWLYILFKSPSLISPRFYSLSYFCLTWTVEQFVEFCTQFYVFNVHQ